MQKPDRTTVVSLLRAYPASMEEGKRIREKTVVQEKTKSLPINPGNEAEVRYTGNERSHADENRLRKRHCQNEKGNKKFRAGKFEQKKYSTPSGWDGSDCDDDRDQKQDWKKIRSRCRKTKKHQRVSERDRGFDQKGFSKESFAALS